MAMNDDSRLDYSDAYPEDMMAQRRNRVRVYIAGPMTNGSGRFFNMAKINEAIKVYFTLIKLGFVPHCPQLTVFGEFMSPNDVSYEQWLELDRCYIDDTDVVLRIEGDSKGADRECEYARHYGKPIIYGLDSFLAKYKEVTV